MKRITIEDDLVIKKPVNGNPRFNQVADDYALNLLKWGAKSKRVGTTVETLVEDNIPFDIDDFRYVVTPNPAQGLGGSVDGYRAMIKITIAQLDEETPTYLPNRVIQNFDDEDNPLPDTYKTWRQWVGVNYTVTEHEGFAYFCTQASGRDLDNTELFTLATDINYEVIDINDFNALVTVEE